MTDEEFYDGLTEEEFFAQMERDMEEDYQKWAADHAEPIAELLHAREKCEQLEATPAQAKDRYDAELKQVQCELVRPEEAEAAQCRQEMDAWFEARMAEAEAA